MVINPTYLAQRTRQSVNWTDCKRRVLWSYREWIRSAPEIQTMYSLNIPVPQLRTKMRQEFERHRYVNQMGVVDMLLFQSHAEFQIAIATPFKEPRTRVFDGLREYIWFSFLEGTLLTLELAGNAKLLEATPSCSQVLPSRRGPKRKTSTELHVWFLRGKFFILPPSAPYLTPV
ncbi:NADH-ubiquinone oxidoreductase 14.8 kDa subunit [Lachnellula willkommii]|uniref:NADH-ubiquinone oxidoreductase 14.8 kDa subunit n=1 Tax=Lachnellula willkommii TaxID=215461 RepID=A0A559M6N7_9HELO|nr:NADH-ubiquinone oxidoreductase 14.8 kDa subunit [Lachnellula willkommii]